MKTNRSGITLYSLYILILVCSRNKDEESNPLVPTGKFVDRWKTETPVEVKI